MRRHNYSVLSLVLFVDLALESWFVEEWVKIKSRRRQLSLLLLLVVVLLCCDFGPLMMMGCLTLMMFAVNKDPKPHYHHALCHQRAVVHVVVWLAEVLTVR